MKVKGGGGNWEAARASRLAGADPLLLLRSRSRSLFRECRGFHRRDGGLHVDQPSSRAERSLKVGGQLGRGNETRWWYLEDTVQQLEDQREYAGPAFLRPRAVGEGAGTSCCTAGGGTSLQWWRKTA